MADSVVDAVAVEQGVVEGALKAVCRGEAGAAIGRTRNACAVRCMPSWKTLEAGIGCAFLTPRGTGLAGIARNV